MAKKSDSSDEIIHKLREIAVLLGQGKTFGEGCKHIAVTEQTYYRWRK